jgi:HD-GYP domain-containing protein (c-di-GMP phosphodiesterase class II)
MHHKHREHSFPLSGDFPTLAFLNFYLYYTAGVKYLSICSGCAISVYSMHAALQTFVIFASTRYNIFIRSMQSKGGPFYMKIRNKLSVWITLVVTLTIVWLGYVSLSYIDRIMFDQTSSLMRLAAKQSATEIDKWFAMRQVLLTSLATDFETEQYEPANPKFLTKLTSMQNRVSSYFEYIFIGFEDRTMYTTRPTPLPPGYDPTTRPWFITAQKQREFVLTEPYPDRLTGGLVTTMALPVNTPVKGVLGIDVSLADMAALCKPAIFHASAEALLLTRNNTILYSTSDALGKTGESLAELDYAPLKKDDIANVSRYYYQMERANIKYVVFISSIPAAHWSIAVVLPTSVLFAEQQNLIDQILYIAIIVFAVVITIIFWIISKITRPLAGLAATAQQLEAGDQTVRFQAGESYEATYLADSLDRMKTKLLGTIEEKDNLLEETIAQNQEIHALYNQMKALNTDFADANRELGLLYTQTIYALSDAIEAKDVSTHGHSSRVLLCCELTGIALGWDQQTMKHLRYAAILHDIGKIGIPEELLNKTSRLTAEEYQMIKLHPALGAKILQNIPHLEQSCAAILQHHEHFSGSGYPRGLAGCDISPLAKVLSISDAYDAMTSTRPYRQALTIGQAYDELQKCAGSQFDPQIVKVFCEAIPELAEEAATRAGGNVEPG